jgi:hypothetical protein
MMCVFVSATMLSFNAASLIVKEHIRYKNAHAEKLETRK